ncbi:MAG: hypothetical protein V4615_08455 [Bacteroidota bacterium]
MKKAIISTLAGLVITVGQITMSSCGKETNSPPQIELIAGSGNVVKDTSLYRGTTFRLAISSNKTGPDDFLSSCKISKSINGGADSTIQEMNFLTQSFSNFYSYQAGDSGNVERYTFMISEQKGLSSSVSVTITDI